MRINALFINANSKRFTYIYKKICDISEQWANKRPTMERYSKLLLPISNEISPYASKSAFGTSEFIQIMLLLSEMAEFVYQRPNPCTGPCPRSPHFPPDPHPSSPTGRYVTIGHVTIGGRDQCVWGGGGGGGGGGS